MRRQEKDPKLSESLFLPKREKSDERKGCENGRIFWSLFWSTSSSLLVCSISFFSLLPFLLNWFPFTAAPSMRSLNHSIWRKGKWDRETTITATKGLKEWRTFFTARDFLFGVRIKREKSWRREAEEDRDQLYLYSFTFSFKCYTSPLAMHTYLNRSFFLSHLL